MDDQAERDLDSDSEDPIRASPAAGLGGRFSISPRLTYLLIGGAALGLIVVMCVVVALIAALQNS